MLVRDVRGRVRALEKDGVEVDYREVSDSHGPAGAEWARFTADWIRNL